MAPLDITMGCLLMGTITAGVLWGISCSQLFYYYTRYHKDPLSLKLLVGTVFVSDSVHQAVIIQSVYAYLVTDYGDPTKLMHPNTGLIIQVFFTALTGLLVQSFFVLRIWRLSNKRTYLVIPVIFLVLAEFSVSVAYAVKAFFLPSFLHVNRIRGLSICMNAFAAAGDVAIAGCLCTILHLSRTEFSKSNALINKLMVFAVNTGLLTSICAVTSLITFFAVPNSFVYITFYYLIGRLYNNSLLATLNARRSLREGTSSGDISLSLRDGQAHSPASAYPVPHSQRGQNGITVRIDTRKDTQHDYAAEYEMSPSKHPLDSV
ncbi:hypothetical protein DICSQDRAFT_77347 [Dichomitus squalens LYAD-421 SS1]|uniref:uncharacterized protein n=1 Tax=Dichomitus squalens (strain LYAD-421) TaxID=732165 RepID=UPI0004412FDB|nr:uncharacterized protein DICSQDRAFT_77347 [Dichomitus squalens LYAD-421 SS1]EJF65671.1 hypothetical protein DICSQDRAFT_77347 [Dichomitus squalens LYAD-421 SS1]